MPNDQPPKPPAPRTLDLPARDYQPTRSELREEMDMPGLSIKQVRKAVFRPLKTKDKAS